MYVTSQYIVFKKHTPSQNNFHNLSQRKVQRKGLKTNEHEKYMKLVHLQDQNNNVHM